MSRSCCGSGSNRRRTYRPFAPRRPRWLAFGAIAAVGALLLLALLSGCSADPRAVAPEASAADVPAAAPAAESAAEGLVSAVDGTVTIPLSELTGNDARFYSYQAADTVVKFFVLRSSDGVVRAAFDACDVCFRAGLGYHQEGDEMVCNNCGTRFPSTQVNEVQGGCNPSPITRTIDGEVLTISAVDLEAGARLFS